MTNTSSNSISSRRNIFNSATTAQLALMSNSSSSSTYPMSNPPPAMLSGQISAPYYRPTITTYPLTSTSYASSSSTRTSYYNNLPASSTVTLNTSNKQPKLKTQKPKLPEYLADTSFAELYYNSNTERSQFDKDPLENLELPTVWNVEDKCTHLSVDPDKLRVNYIGEING
jgi:hypothetical protein